MKNTSDIDVIRALEQILDTEWEFLRPMQVQAIAAIIESVRKWQRVWLIKKPTWVGKTVSFGLILRNLNIPSLVIVPRTNLIDSIRWELVWSEYEKKEWIWVNPNGVYLIKPAMMVVGEKEYRTKNASESLRECLSQIGTPERKDKIIIMTYQSLISIKKSDPSLWALLMGYIWIIISDEAHRSLGPGVQSTYEDTEGFSEFIQMIEQYQKIHLVFTASPRLMKKDVRQIYPVMYHGTFIEAVRNDEIILPSRVTVETLYQGVDGGEYTNVMGTPWDTIMIKKYIELKDSQPHKYFPAVFFCRNIAHAEIIRKELESRWIRTMRVTHNGIDDAYTSSPDEAKKALYGDDIDAVTTVARVVEWWDVPMLRCAVPLYPILSPAKAIQGIGRITRKLPQGFQHLGGVKHHGNTVIIEPRSWLKFGSTASLGKTFFDAPPPRSSHELSPEGVFPFAPIGPWAPVDNVSVKDQSMVGKMGDKEGEEEKRERLSMNNRTPTVLEILYLSGELDAESMQEYFPDVNIASLERLELDERWEITIDGILYVYVGSRTMHHFHETIWPLRAYIASTPDEWKDENMIAFGARVGWQFVDIYRKNGLLALTEKRYEDDKIVDPSKGCYRDTNGHTWFIGMGHASSWAPLPVSSTWLIDKIKKYPGWREKYIRPLTSIRKSNGKRNNVTLIDYIALWTMIAQEYKNFSLTDKLGNMCYEHWASHVFITEADSKKDRFWLLEAFWFSSFHELIEFMRETSWIRLSKTQCPDSKGRIIKGGFLYNKAEIDRVFLIFMEIIGEI